MHTPPIGVRPGGLEYSRFSSGFPATVWIKSELQFDRAPTSMELKALLFTYDNKEVDVSMSGHCVLEAAT